MKILKVGDMIINFEHVTYIENSTYGKDNKPKMYIHFVGEDAEDCYLVIYDADVERVSNWLEEVR